MTRLMITLLMGTGLALLAGCKDASMDKTTADKRDGQRLGKADVDPALTSALEGQIMVDPSLADQANRAAVKPADGPASALIPPETTGPSATAERAAGPTLGELAAQQTRQKSMPGCNHSVSYALHWSTRLPADVPIYPRGRVEEAAGSDTATCRLRVVTFTSSDSPRAVVDFYTGSVRRAGYSVSQEQDGEQVLLGGTRRDGAAVFAIVTPTRSGGTIVDLVVNNGM